MQIQPVSEMQVKTNFQELQSRVEDTLNRSGRRGESVRIVGVTKYVGIEETRWLANAGCKAFGESRPQSLWQKFEVFPELEWHMIGHMQRNKVHRTLPMMHTLHSLDSKRLADQIVADAESLKRTLSALLEINVSGDSTKTGLSESDARQFLQQYMQEQTMRDSIQIVGLMGMSSVERDAARSHQEFARVRKLRDNWKQEFGMALPELSMGMSDDFEIAIEHGSTMIRVGSKLFQSSPH